MDDLSILETCARQMKALVAELGMVTSLPPIAIARLASVIRSIQQGSTELDELAIVARVRAAVGGQSPAGGVASNPAGDGDHVPAPENGSPWPDATKRS